MNIRTPRVCIQMICFYASHRSQFPEANKPGNYLSQGRDRLSLTETWELLWEDATEDGESVIDPKDQHQINVEISSD